MKFNGTIFSKPQQGQLKENIGNELEKVSAKVDEVDARMLNYKGDWVGGGEYYENDIVTWTDNGQLYEVIKAHTSSDTLKPGNTEYYKAMTNIPIKSVTYTMNSAGERTNAINLIKTKLNRITAIHVNGDENSVWHCDNIREVTNLNTETVMLSNIDYEFNDYLSVTAVKIKFMGIFANGIASNILTINTDGTISNQKNINFGRVTICYI